MDTDTLKQLVLNASHLHVFGYGSLLWKTDFKYDSKQVGFIKNYVRRFDLGNSTHRGTEKVPGRVAHIEESQGSKAWGVAFKISGKADIMKALSYLNNRECELGGYTTLVTEFHPREQPSQTITVLCYTATQNNKFYLGPTSYKNMAKQVVSARGKAGTNVEYVTKIADYVKFYIPEDQDEHLFELDYEIRFLVKQKRLSANNKLIEDHELHIQTLMEPVQAS
ncbi:hypothetical protein LOTGIDRAFT_236920 [Lottia gigantea]|uniref:glutathione-specific gamma-glutamylcyclotransferase n=1 Tax=Lottia gigantea TaxID=225164 RepID=V3ZQ57_LOTGI|nr:hypothetical protein LOTGIDRAFT_236920 [Lottia gigantea]ESO83011.1 hypothetical protein LOTGIDRAFT_236920 [Lottia gigantea]